MTDPAKKRLKDRCHTVIFGHQTKAGWWFDVVLLAFIILSVIAVALESIESINSVYGDWLYRLEWFFTILFTVEYAIRIWVSNSRRRYIFSFYGLVDLIAIIPTYLSLFVGGAQALTVVRSLRLLRMFRVLKLAQFVGHGNQLAIAIAASRYKIVVFLLAVLAINLIVGSTMYLIEGAEAGFTSIPKSVYWSIVTMTTVGYGDIAPQTPLGQTVAAFVMIMGYGVIAVPTGIVTSEITSAHRAEGPQGTNCVVCKRVIWPASANFCQWCGESNPKRPD